MSLNRSSIHELPDELIDYIASSVDRVSLQSFASTSSCFFNTLKKHVKALELLSQCAYGRQQAVVSLIDQEIALLFEKQSVTDLSGRTFHNVSVFQLSMWNLDYHMWVAIIERLPKRIQYIKYWNALLLQCSEIKQNGLKYSLNGEVHTSLHFNLESYKIACEAFYTGFKSYVGHQRLCELYNDICLQQKLFPINFIEEICLPARSMCQDKDDYPDFNSNEAFVRLFEGHQAFYTILEKTDSNEYQFKFNALIRGTADAVQDYAGGQMDAGKQVYFRVKNDLLALTSRCYAAIAQR